MTLREFYAMAASAKVFLNARLMSLYFININ
jgi:hypothetical protein